MDMLIIKKEKYVKIKNQIGKIFREHNVIEYKCEEDSMNIDTYIKVKGYAYIYKANEEHPNDILLNEITITLVREAYPRNLIKWFQEEGYTVTEEYPGIYYMLKERDIPVQILVSRKLSEEHQKWLTLLKSGLNEEEMKRAVCQTNELEEKAEKDQAGSVMQVVIKENSEVFALVKEDAIMCEALRELMAKEIQEEVEKGVQKELQKAVEKAVKEATEEGRLEGAFQLVNKKNISVEIAASESGLSVGEFLEKMKAYEATQSN